MEWLEMLYKYIVPTFSVTLTLNLTLIVNRPLVSQNPKSKQPVRGPFTVSVTLFMLTIQINDTIHSERLVISWHL